MPFIKQLYSLNSIRPILVTLVNIILLSIFFVCLFRCTNNVTHMSINWSWRDTSWFTLLTPVKWTNLSIDLNTSSEAAWIEIMNSTDCSSGDVYMRKSLSWKASEKSGLCSCLHTQRRVVTLYDSV
jgi:hypothetical protein